MKITISNLERSDDFEVAREVSPTRVIFVDDAGLFEFADRAADGTWDRSSTDPTEVEKALLAGCIQNFDKTTVEVTPPTR